MADFLNYCLCTYSARPTPEEVNKIADLYMDSEVKQKAQQNPSYRDTRLWKQRAKAVTWVVIRKRSGQNLSEVNINMYLLITGKH